MNITESSRLFDMSSSASGPFDFGSSSRHVGDSGSSSMLDSSPISSPFLSSNVASSSNALSHKMMNMPPSTSGSSSSHAFSAPDLFYEQQNGGEAFMAASALQYNQTPAASQHLHSASTRPYSHSHPFSQQQQQQQHQRQRQEYHYMNGGSHPTLNLNDHTLYGSSNNDPVSPLLSVDQHVSHLSHHQQQLHQQEQQQQQRHQHPYSSPTGVNGPFSQANESSTSFGPMDSSHRFQPASRQRRGSLPLHGHAPLHPNGSGRVQTHDSPSHREHRSDSFNLDDNPRPVKRKYSISSNHNSSSSLSGGRVGSKKNGASASSSAHMKSVVFGGDDDLLDMEGDMEMSSPNQQSPMDSNPPSPQSKGKESKADRRLIKKYAKEVPVAERKQHHRSIEKMRRQKTREVLDELRLMVGGDVKKKLQVLMEVTRQFKSHRRDNEDLRERLAQMETLVQQQSQILRDHGLADPINVPPMELKDENTASSSSTGGVTPSSTTAPPGSVNSIPPLSSTSYASISASAIKAHEQQQRLHMEQRLQQQQTNQLIPSSLPTLTENPFERIARGDGITNIFWESETVGLYIETMNQKIVAANKAFRLFTGLRDCDLDQGVHAMFLVPEFRIPEVYERVHLLVSGKQKCVMRYGAPVWCRLGHPVKVDLTFTLQRDEAGEPQFFICFAMVQEPNLCSEACHVRSAIKDRV